MTADTQRPMRPVLLGETKNQLETEMIKSVLEQNGIYVLVKDAATGGYMRLYMGFSIYGESLYVDESQHEAALELWQAFAATDGEAALAELQDQLGEMAEEEQIEDEEKLILRKTNKKQFYSIVVIAICVMALVWRLIH